MMASEFVTRLVDVAENYKTLYVMGCFGAPMTSKNKERYCDNHDYNRKATRTKMIQKASGDTFGFDCVNLIKSILWGWCGDKTKTYGGAKYNSNGVPDVNADNMIGFCKDVSTTFIKLDIGELLWCKGHVGVYIGDGLAVECSPAWTNKVQITAVANLGTKAGYKSRKWTKHGKLPYIEYDVTDSSKKADTVVYAESKDVELAGLYENTYDLHLRSGAGIRHESLCVIPKGTMIQNHGYYTQVDSTKWLYVTVRVEGVNYVGFCSSKYLKRL